jgi:hypothetical protein
VRSTGGHLTGSTFWLATSATLALTAFVHKAWRTTNGPAGPIHVPLFWGLAFLFYVVAVVRTARRLGCVPPDQARGELYRAAGLGFVLVYFALEMP